MEMAGRAMNLATRVINNNICVDVFLGGCFVALGVRSANQQRDIETLEAQNESLIQSNKALKKSIWESKQTLYAEASSPSAIVPLSKLKAIYGEAVLPVPASKLLYSLNILSHGYLFCVW